MRIALTVFGLAVAIAANWPDPLAAQTDLTYDGPRNINFRSSGILAPTLNGSADLVTGLADVIGPCGRGMGAGAPCGPSDRRHLSLSSSELATLRSLAIEARSKGLLDANCVEDLKAQNQLNETRRKKEAEEEQVVWLKHHQGPAPRPPVAPPLDPFYASLTIDGVGSVDSFPEVGGEKPEIGCMAQATATLWNMVLNPFSPMWLPPVQRR